MKNFFKYFSLVAAILAALVVAWNLIVVFTVTMPRPVLALLLVLSAGNSYLGYVNFQNFRRLQAEG